MQPPVQRTNVVQILQGSVPAEHQAVLARLAQLRQERSALLEYDRLLRELADDAGIDVDAPIEASDESRP